MKLVHMPGKEIPADPLSRLTNLPSAAGSELNSSVDFEPRYPLPHPLDKINKVLFLESADKERVVERAFSEITPSMHTAAESAPSQSHTGSRTSTTPSGLSGSFTPLRPHASYESDISVRCIYDTTGEGIMESCQSQECKLCKCTWRKEGESPCNSCTECTPRITMPCAPHSRCAQCVLVLAAQQEVEPPPRKPDIDEEIGYRLVQEAPAIREGVWDPATLSMAQGADPACQEVFTWFGGDLSPTRPPTLRPEETSGELKWFNSRFEKLRLVHYKDGTILLAILSETEQGEKPSKNENLEAVKIIVPVSQRTAVITMAHSKAHWGVTKTVGAIVDHFTWEKMREDVKKFVLQCAICLEKQGVNLKEGAHMPRVSHEQGEIVYLDLIGPVSEKISSFKYLLTMMDGFS
jgi:hypothetical protein